VVKLYLRVDDNIDNELMESIICMLKFLVGTLLYAFTMKAKKDQGVGKGLLGKP